jgi:hypothetical protein
VSTLSKLRSAVALLAVTALVAAGCGESDTAGPAKDGKATSTPAAKKSQPSGY